MKQLESYIPEIFALCKHHKVKKLYVFGSVLTESFNPESDIDLIVEFNKIDEREYADNYYDLKFSLQDVLKRPVDLLEEQAIKNPYFREIVDKQKQVVYGN